METVFNIEQVCQEIAKFSESNKSKFYKSKKVKYMLNELAESEILAIGDKVLCPFIKVDSNKYIKAPIKKKNYEFKGYSHYHD